MDEFLSIPHLFFLRSRFTPHLFFESPQVLRFAQLVGFAPRQVAKGNETRRAPPNSIAKRRRKIQQTSDARQVGRLRQRD